MSQPGVSRRPLDVMWDVRHGGGHAFALLVEREPRIGPLLDDVAASCPIADTATAFSGAAYERPGGHARSFFLRLSDHGVLVFKGTEPLSTDFGKVFEAAWRRRNLTGLSPMDHFALREDEVYLAVTASGALSCAARTRAWVESYAARFGELPHTPVPLLVLGVPNDITEQFGVALAPYLSDRSQISARRRVMELIGRGLAVYVYYYPGRPIRLAHARGVFPGAFGVGVEGAESMQFDTDAAVDSWIGLFSRMLVAGFVPTTPVHTGNCLQSQNVAIDGGFCDIDSVEELAALVDLRDLAGALAYSLQVFTATVAGAVGLPGTLVSAFLWKEISARTIAAGRSGPCDKRILDILNLGGLDALRWFVRPQAR